MFTRPVNTCTCPLEVNAIKDIRELICNMTSWSNSYQSTHPKVKGEIVYFLVNASPPKPLDVATSNFADALVR